MIATVLPLSCFVWFYRFDVVVRVTSRSISPQWRSIRFRSAPRTSRTPHGGVTHRTCGEPNEIKKNTHPKILPLFFMIT